MNRLGEILTICMLNDKIGGLLKKLNSPQKGDVFHISVFFCRKLSTKACKFYELVVKYNW